MSTLTCLYLSLLRDTIIVCKKTLLLQSMFDRQLSTLGASFATNTFSVGMHITETCLQLHNTHLRTALHLLSRCPGVRHAKQHPLLTAKFLFSTMLKLCALGQDSLVCDPSQDTRDFSRLTIDQTSCRWNSSSAATFRLHLL